MIVAIAYVAFIAYAAGLFVYSVTHGRALAALGILLSVSGFQLAMLGTINPDLGIAVAIAGLVLVGRDVYVAVTQRLVPARAQAQTPSIDRM